MQYGVQTAEVRTYPEPDTALCHFVPSALCSPLLSELLRCCEGSSQPGSAAPGV